MFSFVKNRLKLLTPKLLTCNLKMREVAASPFLFLLLGNYLLFLKHTLFLKTVDSIGRDELQ